MRRKKCFLVFLTGLASLLLLSGCSIGGRKEDKKEVVTIALWSDKLLPDYGKYLQETFPDVELQFYVATNSTDFYRYKEKTGNLPDILTVRRFSLRDVSEWKDSLMDLSDSDLANTFHQSYLRSYAYSDGTVNWLPACAEIDSIVVNRELLEENGIAIPSDYQEFVEVCGELRERGIRPFLSNFDEDYTCMEILQGLSVSQLTSQEGREWRQLYESGHTDQLSEEVWLPVFQRFQEFIEYTGITEDDFEGGHLAVLNAYKNGELAMMRGTGNEDAIRRTEGKSVLMPYFGETQEDNWYLTYPVFQIAASANASEDSEREQLILDIMTAMLNEEGLQKISGGGNMIPYNKDVHLELSPELDNMQPYIDSNRLYIRLASSEMFSVSEQVVQGMITGEYPDARSAFDAFNAAMKAGAEEQAAAVHLDTGYRNSFRPDGGNQAASAVMNSLREEVGTQLLVGQTFQLSGNIAEGDYTEAELGFLITGSGGDVLICEMTGEQLFAFLDRALHISADIGAVYNRSTLYASSGFEMEVRETEEGYVLERLTIEGKDMDPGQSYSVAVLGYETVLKEILAAGGITEYTKQEAGCRQLITNRLMSGRQLAQPADYITLR